MGHLRALARVPRFTGSPEAADARRYCARELERLGFTVVERRFTYSQFPARYATPCAGLWSAGALVVAALMAEQGTPRASLLISVASLVVLAATGVWLARRGVLAFPAARREGVNVEATRGQPSPRVWLVAHTDSKSQLVPMLGRVISVVLLASSWAGAIVLATYVLARDSSVSSIAWSVVAVAGAMGGLGVACTVVGNRSPGAVDDASGVAAVLAAAALLPGDSSVGVLITDAEEMGLAGARAAARVMPRATAINVDGVDDHGMVMAMYSGAKPERLLNASAAASRAEGELLRERRLIPGVLVDGIAFADAGWMVVTLSRGTARTLRRIHTQADSLEQMRGDGIPIVARIISRTVLELSSWHN